jgi:hypothetical protein
MSLLASLGWDRVFFSLRQNCYKKARANASGNNPLVKSSQFGFNLDTLTQDRIARVAASVRTCGLPARLPRPSIAPVAPG